MQDIVKGDSRIMQGLEKLCTGKDAIRQSEDSFGNSFQWYRLDYPGYILDGARILHAAGARLAIIATYRQKDSALYDACYEFVFEGVVYGVTAHLDAEHDFVPSIARIFPNADWHEREMMELFGIKIKDQPNPRRLFLDEELDKGLVGEIVPLSVMMNGATSSELWERILADKEAGR